MMNRIFVNRLCGLWLLSVGLAACVTPSVHDRTFKSRYADYVRHFPVTGWRNVSIKEADAAWVSEADDSSLLVNSLCQNSDDIPLLALTNHLLIGMTEQTVVSQKTMPWSGREALESIISAKVDGVSRRFRIFVFKKNGCVYDVILASSPNNFDAHEKAYEAVLDQLKVDKL